MSFWDSAVRLGSKKTDSDRPLRKKYSSFLRRKQEKYIHSVEFQKDLQDLFVHDQQEFDEPTGWQTKTIQDSPLISDFPNLWSTLQEIYLSELPMLAFSEIPKEKVIKENFIELMKKVTDGNTILCCFNACEFTPTIRLQSAKWASDTKTQKR